MASVYAVFLTGGTSALLADAERLVRAELYRRGWDDMPAWPLPLSYLWDVPWHARAGTIDYLVIHLVALGLTVERVRAVGPASTGQRRCPNPSCPLFDVATAHNIRVRGRRAGSCTVCGSCFVGDRLVVTVDRGTAPDRMDPRDRRIGHLRLRVALWQRHLEEVCRDLMLTGAPISLDRAFDQAGVPPAPHLRAVRVGLRAVVAHYAILQEAMPPCVAATTIVAQRAPLVAGQGTLAVTNGERRALCHERRRRPDRPSWTDTHDEDWRAMDEGRPMAASAGYGGAARPPRCAGVHPGRGGPLARVAG